MEMLENVIQRGRENAIHKEKLAELLHVSVSTAKKEVRQARARGALILSDKSGYWIAENEAEARRFIRTMRQQALSRLQSAKHIKNSMPEIQGQLSFETIGSGPHGGAESGKS